MARKVRLLLLGGKSKFSFFPVFSSDFFVAQLSKSRQQTLRVRWEEGEDTCLEFGDEVACKRGGGG